MLALFEVLKEIQINIRYVCMCKSIPLYILHTIHSIDVNHQIATQHVFTE